MDSPEPDYVVHPGEFITEWLDENAETQSSLAQRMGVSPKHVSELVNGRVAITAPTALKLELTTGILSDQWLGWESLYQADKARLAARQDAAEARALAETFPLADLRRRGHLTATLRSPGDLVLELMAFFRVATPSELSRCASPPQGFAYRSSHSEVNWPARRAWLRLGEIAAETGVAVTPYRREELWAIMPGLRELIVTPPEHFGSEVARRLAQVGVTLTYVKEVRGTRAFGATRFFRGRPLVQLSLRRRDDGQFWFTLIHELAHLLLHAADRNTFIHDTEDPRASEAEAEADRFAQEFLIPAVAWAQRGDLRSKSDVKRYAGQIGVSPGVLLGRLHHEGVWPPQHGNELFTKLEIVES